MAKDIPSDMVEEVEEKRHELIGMYTLHRDADIISVYMSSTC